MAYSSQYKRILSRMGYYNYQNGLIFRHLNQQGGWDEHLGHCRRYIMKAVEHFRPQRVTILGSGWLLDLPVAELIEKQCKIFLVDIVHPPDVKKQVAGLQNVHLVEADVTGGIVREIWNKTGRFTLFKKNYQESDLTISEFVPDFDPGLVISLNILTQLEFLPLKYLKNRYVFSPEEELIFRKKLQENHLSFLKKHNSVMISDYEELYFNKDVQEVKSTLVADISQDLSREEWTWKFDLTGSDYYNKRSIMKVMAVTFMQPEGHPATVR